MIGRILGLCSRNDGHPAMYEILDRVLSNYRSNRLSYESLLHEAERHGVAPLLYKHLEYLNFSLPDSHHRILRSLNQRCRLSNQIRNHAIAEILSWYQQQKIDTLLVKGIALANFVYDAPGLRPMRDIDILVGKSDLDKAEQTLLELGYQQDQAHQIPEDYYHLPPLAKTIEGLPVTIELHHDLLPPDTSYPRWPLEKSINSAQPVMVNGVETATLNLEDSLYYLYLHGFGTPLSYEEFRFIHVADMVSLTENYYQQIDWDQATTQFERLAAILSRFHFLTPWQDEIISGLKLDISRAPRRSGIGYRGWPLYKLKDTPLKMIAPLIYETFYPSQWWTQVYYGHLRGASYLKVRLFQHPRAVWRWIKASIRQYFQKSARSSKN